MLGVLLALAVTVGAEDQALVAQLGSPRYLERESAESALVRRGRAALPVLRAAAHHRDLEIRVRAASVLRQLERSLILEPTPIRFDFRDAPLAEILRRTSERSHLRLEVDAADQSVWSGRKVTLERPDTLPFWAGIDQLCASAGLSYAVGSGEKEGSILFRDETATTVDFLSDSGPFRSQLASISYQNEVALSRPRPGVAGTENPSSPSIGGVGPRSCRQMSFQLLVAAEPRLAITQDGPVRLIEAIDERGQTFVPTADSTTVSHSSGYFGMNSTPWVRLRVELARPEEPGRRLARIKGVVPLMVSARVATPLVVSLADPSGRVHSDDQTSLVVRSARLARGDQPSVIELTLTSDADQAGTRPDDRPDPEPSRADISPQQLEVLDARGNALAWFPTAARYEGRETRLTLTIGSQAGANLPATLRYHPVVRIATEVPFEFLDVPMP